MGRRRGRRRAERQRAKRPPRPKRSIWSRLGFVVLGLLMIVAGLGLLVGGGRAPAGSFNRLSRVAGILIIVGAVLVGVGVIGA